MKEGFRTGRAPVFSRQGVVASGHPLASSAGLRVLMQGGNAVDAAVAVAGVLGVVQPMMSGLGGDTFVVLWQARDRTLHALNGSGVAPYAATREWFASRGYAQMPLRGMLAASVPGAVDAMAVALERWGSGRFSLRQLLAPAIAYAEDGFPVAPRVGAWLAEHADLLARYPSSARVYLPEGRPPRAGEVLVLRDLARSLKAVAEGGPEEFYRGELARRIAAYCREHGGLLTAREFADHRSEITAPLATTYRGITVCTTPPPSQGIILLEMLNLLEGFAPEALAPGTARGIHLMVEAKKLAVADRLAYLGDPRMTAVPTEVLLSKAFAARRRRAIDPARAQPPAAGTLAEAAGATTYFCVADRDGNAVSFITSLSAVFGCGEVVEGTGILLNNRAGRGFTLQEGHPNCIAPGKRTMHTLMPFLALRDGAPWLIWGTPGGDAQPQWSAQVFSAIVDAGLPVQAAVERPRWVSFPATDPHHLPAPFEVQVEPGFAPAVLAELERLGHTVRRLAAPDDRGGVQAVAITAGVYAAGSDPRVDGCAAGY